MVMAPERAGPTFEVTLKLTRPPPLPLAPEVTAIHAAWLETVQLQPEGAATSKVAEPALAPIDATPGVIEYEQTGCGGGGFGAPSA